MIQTFTDFFDLFVELIYSLVEGLQQSILSFTTIDIQTIVINLVLASDLPIVTTNLYEVVFFTLLVITVLAFTKLFIWLIQAPINAFRRWL